MKVYYDLICIESHYFDIILGLILIIRQTHCFYALPTDSCYTDSV